MEISRKAWNRYLVKLRNISNKAADELMKFILNGHDPYVDPEMVDEVIRYAYALATKYGEAAGSLACEMFDAIAELANVSVPAAVPAPTATYGEIAKAVHGTILQSNNPEVMAGALDRSVKMVSVDTIQQNAIENGWEWAWVPSGDTCAFCLTLASRGWQVASKDALKNGHAEHVHANCDCTYMTRPLNSDLNVENYEPEKYKEMYDEGSGSPKDKINYMRRQFYAENKEEINEQKRDAYEKRKELNSSAAEEYEVTE